MGERLTYDFEKSERGRQRRKSDSGTHLHCCCICGRLAFWGPMWSTFCSVKELDDEAPIPKFCSDECRAKGGEDASLVTAEMKQAAKDAEWRDPTPAYRPKVRRRSPPPSRAQSPSRGAASRPCRQGDAATHGDRRLT